MKDFIYYTPTKVFFGKDKEKEVGKIISEYGYKKIMLQYGKGSIKKSGLYDVIMKSLKDNGIEVVEMGGVEPNPKLSFVRKAGKVAKDEKVELILAVGGGSVLDSSKMTAMASQNEEDVWEFSMGRSKPKASLPVACVLTLAAAGSEMSSSAVLTNEELNTKKGCNSDFNRCKFAIINPELMYSVPKYQTVCGIVDIMSHTLERYFSLAEPTDLTDMIAESILKATINAGKILMENPRDYDARANMVWASSLSHNDLTGCGRENYLCVHQLEHALSGEFDHVTHGAGLAVLFPAWAKYVRKYNVSRFARFARNVWGVMEEDDEKASILGIEKMSEYFISLGIESKLREFNIPKESIEKLVKLCTFNYTRTIKSYIPLDKKELTEIFESCY
jgi:alcohol dehydrogenase YqhD (iron-dependent ADH family)